MKLYTIKHVMLGFVKRSLQVSGTLSLSANFTKINVQGTAASSELALRLELIFLGLRKTKVVCKSYANENIKKRKMSDPSSGRKIDQTKLNRTNKRL